MMQPSAWALFWARRTRYASGGLLIFFGAWVALGWQLPAPALIQLWPGTIAIGNCTALCLITCGVGRCSLALGRYELDWVWAFRPLVRGGLFIFEYVVETRQRPTVVVSGLEAAAWGRVCAPDGARKKADAELQQELTRLELIS